jgi:glucans biosynthesis protein
VRLYSFPTDSEYTDNVVAYWTPSAPATPGQRIDASYRVDWSAARAPASEALGNEVAIVQNVWRGRGDEEGSDRLVIDFAGVTDGAKPEIWTDISAGTMIKTAGYPVLGQPGLYRMVLDLKREGAGLTDIRAQLRLGDRAISEYVHYPVGP